MDLISRPGPGYRLLDSGAGAKLEELGALQVVRPCVQAIWPRRLPPGRWAEAASVHERSSEGGGRWRHGGRAVDPGSFAWEHAGLRLRFALRLTDFGHCGVFFEQLPIWERVAAELRTAGPGAGFANLFGYTGAASLVGAACAARVFHVDSAKGVLDWGRANQLANDLGAAPLRWIHDDVRSFLRLGAKRGFRYRLILADPPAWGHGTKSETWTWEQDIAALLGDCAALLEEGGVLLLTCHTPGVQRWALETLLVDAGLRLEGAGELGLAHDADDRVLPAGLWAQARRG